MDYKKFKGIEVGMYGLFERNRNYNGVKVKDTTKGTLIKIDSSKDTSFFCFDNKEGYLNFTPYSRLDLFTIECKKIFPNEIDYYVVRKLVDDEEISFHKENASMPCMVCNYSIMKKLFSNFNLPEYLLDVSNEMRGDIHD